MITAIIVEDEYLAREELSYLIDKYSDIKILTSFDDGLEAFKYLQLNQVDVVFLDINIPSIDGVMLAKNLHQMSVKPHIIFSTAYKEHAVDAFEIEALDYLLKPLNEQRVKQALEKIQIKMSSQAIAEAPQVIDHSIANNVQHSDVSHPQSHSEQEAKRQPNMPLNDGNKICIVDKQDIIYLWADERITYVYTKQGQTLVAHHQISEVMNRLPDADFYRCHRSFGVNLKSIQQIKPAVNSTYLLTLHGAEKEVPVSRGNVKQFRLKMGL